MYILVILFLLFYVWLCMFSFLVKGWLVFDCGKVMSDLIGIVLMIYIFLLVIFVFGVMGL